MINAQQSGRQADLIPVGDEPIQPTGIIVCITGGAAVKQTPLFDLHLRLGAKMTEFAGYRMPLHYPAGIIREHLHCRSRAGLFDISHMGQCRIVGARAAQALETLTPGGLAGLPPGRQKYTVLLNQQGGVIDDIIVTRVATGLAVVVNAGCKDKDYAYLRQALPEDCEFSVQDDLALLALQGPEAVSILGSLAPEASQLAFMHGCHAEIAGIQCWISRSGYTGEDGFEISLAAGDAQGLAILLLQQDGVAPIGLGARDTLRMEAGLCLYGHELGETISPVEAGLGWLFPNEHSDFPGSEIILAHLRRGPPRRRVGLAIEGKLPVREGTPLFNGETQIGAVSSGGYSPSLARPIAMALVETEFATAGTRLTAQVRDQYVAVSVCKLPFVQHRYRR